MKNISEAIAPTHWKHVLLAGLIGLGPQQTLAQENVFAPGWTMNTDASALRFQSVKNQTTVESSTFGTYTGTIDENGFATIRVLLNSVDTNVDLRNVRMRFLLFETFQYPEAVITLQIDPAQLSDLEKVRRKVMMANYTIDLHGVKAEREAEIAVMLLDPDTVSVTSSTPISLPTADFNLDGGVAKLEDAADVQILPSATVTFDFTFNRADTRESYNLVSAQLDADAGFTSVALQEDDPLSVAGCKRQLENMSRKDDIRFASGSARLDKGSGPFLTTVAEIINRCPEMTISVDGHTDSDGSASNNQRLSEARAKSVRAFLVNAGVDGARVSAKGYGETLPVVSNDTAENKQRNRRIEFTVAQENLGQ